MINDHLWKRQTVRQCKRTCNCLLNKWINDMYSPLLVNEHYSYFYTQKRSQWLGEINAKRDWNKKVKKKQNRRLQTERGRERLLNTVFIHGYFTCNFVLKTLQVSESIQ